MNIEADRSFSNLANGGQFDQTLTARTRTFYGRYWSPATESFCTNCVGAIPNNLALIAPWDQGFGDEREPLGLKYAARWFEGSGVHTDFVAWRASATVAAGVYSATFLKDLTTNQFGSAGNCTSIEPWPLPTTFYDEDENTVGIRAPLPSPLPPFELFNPFPRETQKLSVGTFPRPAGAVAGWVSFEFGVLTSNPNGTVLDQAWMGQEMTSPDFTSGVSWTSSNPSTPLDPSTCNPLGLPIGPFSGGVNGPIAPVIPVVLATGPPQ